MIAPKLRPVNLKKPRLSSRSRYLVCIGFMGARPQWEIGMFTREWFGWSFTSDEGTHSQLDGDDGTVWKAIYLIPNPKK